MLHPTIASGKITDFMVHNDYNTSIQKIGYRYRIGKEI